MRRQVSGTAVTFIVLIAMVLVIVAFKLVVTGDLGCALSSGIPENCMPRKS